MNISFLNDIPDDIFQLLNTVYIDNTYAAEHCKFPSRKEVIEKAVELIE